MADPISLGDPDSWLKVYTLASAVVGGAGGIGVILWRLAKTMARFDMTIEQLTATQAKHSEAIDKLTAKLGEMPQRRRRG
jgi:hypothetical protein